MCSWGQVRVSCLFLNSPNLFLVIKVCMQLCSLSSSRSIYQGISGFYSSVCSVSPSWNFIVQTRFLALIIIDKMGNRCGPEKQQRATFQWYGNVFHNLLGESQIYKDPQSIYFIVKSYQSDSKQTLARLKKIARIQSNYISKLHVINEFPINCANGPCSQAYWDYFSLNLFDLLQLRRKKRQRPIHQEDLWHLVGSASQVGCTLLFQKLDYQLSINNIYLSPQGFIKVFIKPSDIDCKQYLIQSRKIIPAPEEFQIMKEKGRLFRDQKSQVFRLGLIALFMAIQHRNSMTWKQFQQKIITAPVHRINFQFLQSRLVEMLDDFSQELTLLVANMLTQKAGRRISFLKILKDFRIFFENNTFIKLFSTEDRELAKTKNIKESRNLQLSAKMRSK